jgi:hypothetical protein
LLALAPAAFSQGKEPSIHTGYEGWFEQVCTQWGKENKDIIRLILISLLVCDLIEMNLTGATSRDSSVGIATSWTVRVRF